MTDARTLWGGLIALFMLVIVLPVVPAYGQGGALRPDSCGVSRSNDVAAITFRAAPFDNANRYILFRTEDGGRPIWTAWVGAARGRTTFTVTETDDVAYVQRPRSAVGRS